MKRMIWSNNYDTIEELEKEILANPDDYGYDINEENAWAVATEINAEYLEDEKATLDKELGQTIVMIGHLGLWFGNRDGYKFVRGTNLNDIFSGTCGDYVTWYVEDGDVKCEDIHHDGTNHYTYRTIKDGISDFEFEELIAEGKDVDELTDKLGRHVMDAYGWAE